MPSADASGPRDVCCPPWSGAQTSHVCVVSYRNEEDVLIAVELSYIGQECHSIPTILGRIYGKKARRLDLSFNALSDLNGLEMFPFLEELVLDNNSLGDNVEFRPLPHLHTLSLNKNNFTDLDRLLKELVRCYPQLKYLSLLGNPACPDQLSNCEKDDEDYTRYRFYVLYQMPCLKFLDSTPVRDYERAESKRVGPYVKVVKLLSDESDKAAEVENVTQYSPLPSNIRREGSHRGAFGKLRQRYTGLHSEGNRFIRDKEL